MATLGISSALGVAGATSAIPIVGPILGGLTLLSAWLFGTSKNGQQKISASDLVNKAEPLLKQNLANYLAAPYSPDNQTQALAYFDAVWAQLTGPNGLANSAYGDAGKKGIADRSRGGQWDWFAYYRDPITNDPRAAAYTQAQTAQTAQTLSTALAAASSAGTPTTEVTLDSQTLLIGGGLLLAALIL